MKSLKYLIAIVLFFCAVCCAGVYAKEEPSQADIKEKSSQDPPGSQQTKKKILKIPREVVEQAMPSYMYDMRKIVKKAETNIEKLQKIKREKKTDETTGCEE